MSMFIDGLAIVAAICFYIGVTCWCVLTWEDGLKHRFLSTLICVVMNSFLLGAIVKSEKQNPCIQYETQMHYDATTKTTRPMKVCIERGEWVE